MSVSEKECRRWLQELPRGTDGGRVRSIQVQTNSTGIPEFRNSEILSGINSTWKSMGINSGIEFGWINSIQLIHSSSVVRIHTMQQIPVATVSLSILIKSVPTGWPLAGGLTEVLRHSKFNWAKNSTHAAHRAGKCPAQVWHFIIDYCLFSKAAVAQCSTSLDFIRPARPKSEMYETNGGLCTVCALLKFKKKTPKKKGIRAQRSAMPRPISVQPVKQLRPNIIVESVSWILSHVIPLNKSITNFIINLWKLTDSVTSWHHEGILHLYHF